mmetsp:Transcript_14471/g.41075  ORF Transcript_14471/g.41075 Transcript_14471/m.41075 type:complete len:1015 (+) Transcript_14471:281-3325(+)|eukprot:CAMPEP_0119564626 /NCGR_PEP_ID=MMETSP1352-20130426/27572_1 /TAXON_ID=265584 /ORGANISM="Stauroneis constricta, Strain CCMP1120" /LENGTH=1014 /DNA_ID=CAMNT_0007613401 /DNA_START=216 /DNA_END=3260 /DNA_ORIENTATION=+
MGFFSKRSGGRNDYETRSHSTSSRRQDRGRSPRRYNRGDSDDDGYSQHSSNSRSPRKTARVKKMRMRMLRGKKGSKGGNSYSDDTSMSSRAPSNRGGRSNGDYYGGGGGPPQQGYDDQDYYEDNFQLDNAPRNVRPNSASSFNPADKIQESLRADKADSTKKFRVKPHHVFPSPCYLNEEGLYQSMMEPSEEVDYLTSYLDPSTKATRRAKVPEAVRRTFGTPKDDGRIGALKVEVLGCVGLARAKPDVVVYLVVGDCAFATDMISGFRSPMWPNVSKRSAVFPLHHAYARLFVGVFDVRQKKASEADAFCGRIAIDVPPLRPDTEYDITFPLRNSSFIYDRRPRGVIRLRFSLHWFSERAVLLSYMRRPKNPLAFSKQAKKQPTIPCGDPKTFRNVAVTVHGVDFPGKYTRAAFRATMREFNLYQQNLRFLFKVTIMDCILYENPLMSLYLFSTCMYCVWQNSVRMVPPIFVGWIIFLFVENYLTYCITASGHLGYRPLTILEMFKGALRDGSNRKSNFNPIMVRKRAKTQSEETRDIELINHREFPFSERFEYHKFSAAEAIAPSPTAKKKGQKGGGGNDMKTTRRLSIYVAPVEEKEEDSDDSDVSDDESELGDRDDDNMMDQGDDGYNDLDSDAEVEEEGMDAGKGRLLGTGKASATRRIRVGPPQNSDTSGKKQPPQVHLARVEHLMHRASKNISVEMVFFPPPHIQQQLGAGHGNSKVPLSDVISAKEKQNYDEFDRMLGFRARNPNPIIRITSSFLGPLMRIIRIFIYATRISFNLSTWTDPYLSFWVLTFLSTVCFILLIFPWRTFFFLATVILLGPQNIALRKVFERRALEKEIEDKEKKAREKAKEAQEPAGHPAYGGFQSSLAVSALTGSGMTGSSKGKDKKKKRGFFSRKSKDDVDDDESQNEANMYQSPRPAFFSLGRPTTRRTAIPRDVAVPYFRFRKDRFFDWPPDPTVSRATPMFEITGGMIDEGGELDSVIHDRSTQDPRRGRRQQRKVREDDFYYE